MVHRHVPVYLLIAAAVALQMACLRNSEGAEEPQGFCARAEASRRCATPPTVDETESFSVEEYLGRWFEIGSTASFKLLTEAGLVCNQARYSASPNGSLSLLNSGLRVIGPLAMAEVAAVNAAAGGVCTAARQVCRQLPAISQLSASLLNLSGGDGAGQRLQSSGQAAEQALDRLARDVSLMQGANGNISQGEGPSLQASVGELMQYAKEGEREQAAVASLAATISRAGVEAMADVSAGLGKKTKLALGLGSAALEAAAGSAAIEAGLKAAEAGGAALADSGRPISNGGVRSVTGQITQPNATSAGKLEVAIEGNRAPYWIIALQKAADGSYAAAMVYSCREVAGVVAAKSLFVLSRQPQLQKSTLDAFLAKAQALGIYNDCEDPFLLTSQRGGDCGQPA